MGWEEGHSLRTVCVFPILSHRSEAILSAPPVCLAFYGFAFFFFFKTVKYDKSLFREAKHKCSLEQWFLNVNVLTNHQGIWASQGKPPARR